MKKCLFFILALLLLSAVQVHAESSISLNTARNAESFCQSLNMHYGGLIHGY